MTSARIGLLLAGAGAALTGCDEGLQDPSDGQPSSFVSNAVTSPSPDAPTGATVAYVHLPEGTAQTGVAASIRNRNLGTTKLAFPTAGGFDPVPVPARAGDLLDLEVRAESGAVLFVAELRVPPSRRPIVVRSDPPPRKRDVPLNAFLVIVFSEPIAPHTLTAGTIQLVGDDGVVSGQVLLEPNGLLAQFIPARALSPNTDYRLVLSDGVTDLAGESLEPAELEFTTGTTLEPAGVSRIVFGICLDDDRCGLLSMNADGSGVKQLTDPSNSRNLDPAWSPDGRRIAFSGFQHCVFGVPGRCTSEIFVMNADGSGVTRLTNRPDSGSFYPSWSPDGRRITFQSTAFNFPGGGVHAVDIFAMDADGSNLVRLTQDPGFAFAPRWSPDGTRIAFSSGRDGDEEIYVMNADGSNPRRLTQHPGSDHFPAWSPDGLRIAFTSDRDLDPVADGRDIYVMNADGSNPVRLTDDSAYDTGAAWSPDGSRIAFTSGRDGSGLFVMNADGSGVLRLRSGFAGPPSWTWTGTVPSLAPGASRTIRP